jgi:hypothetical protein
VKNLNWKKNSAYDRMQSAAWIQKVGNAIVNPVTFGPVFSVTEIALSTAKVSDV